MGLTVIWILMGILGIAGTAFIGYGLKLQLVIHRSKARQELEQHLETLNLKLQNRQQVRDRVAQHKERFQALHSGVVPTAEDEEVGWCSEDYDWRLDDLEWTIDDIRWDIRDTQFEIDSRQNVESTSRATFWTVLGAAVFSLAGLVLGIVAML